MGGDAHAENPIPEFPSSGAEQSAQKNPAEGDNEDEDDIPPPTPATHFYFHPTTGPFKQQNETVTTSAASKSRSSSSSGAFGAHPSVGQPGSHSPMDLQISPAAMISSTSHENLLLPPAQPSDTLTLAQHQEQHMAWLRELNARAKAAYPAVQQQASYPDQSHMLARNALPQEESEEKRAKRLERNRESARKSRRRKKERLETLEAQVNDLHNQLDAVRNHKMRDIVISLTRHCRNKGIQECIENHDTRAITYIIRNTGPTSSINQSVLEFQYNTLRQRLLPRYQKFFTWLTVQEEQFFTAGKEAFLKREAQGKNNSIRSSAGRISSKQVGDDLTNGPSHQLNQDSGPGIFKSEEEQTGENPNQTAYAGDLTRMWPLLCYDVSFSVDQEEKFLACFKKSRNLSDLPESRAQTVAAVETSETLRTAVEHLGLLISAREEQSFGSILSPTQLELFNNWFEANRTRCARALLRRGSGTHPAIEDIKEASLTDISRRLKMLHISKKQD